MTAYNHAEFNLTKKRDEISADERRMIDAAIAKGKTQTIPQGKSGLDEDLIWKGDPDNPYSFGQLVPKVPVTRAEALAKMKRASWSRRNINPALANRRNRVEELSNQNMTAKEIAAAIGCTETNVKNDRKWLRTKGRDLKPVKAFKGTNPEIQARRDWILKLINEGKTQGEICKITGLPRSKVQNDREAMIKQRLLDSKPTAKQAARAAAESVFEVKG